MGVSNRKGDIAEAKVFFEAVSKGYHVAKMSQDCPYDMIIDRGEGPLRVQIKYTSTRDGRVRLQLDNASRSNKRSYQRTDLDAFIIYIPEKDLTYWIPFNSIPEQKEIHFRVDVPKNNRDIKNNIEDYKIW